MSTAEQNKLTLAYEGSVKRVWQCPFIAESLLFQFTDDYSVFDWGKMPDTIENKGKALALFGAYFFDALSKASLWQELVAMLLQEPAAKIFCREYLQTISAGTVMKSLQKDGLASHFQGLVDKSGERFNLQEAADSADTIYMQVRKADVARPSSLLVLNQNIFYYPPVNAKTHTRLVPLEVVFRFGMPAGSSLTERLKRDPSYARILGLKSNPQEGEKFDRPVLEFYTKLEPKDRLLSEQEALLISGLGPDQFCDMVERAQLISLALFLLFSKCGIELWDGKFEFILHEGTVLLADSIGPDELRLLYRGTHLSKEMIRQVYRGTSWEKALKEAQILAVERCKLDWKSICRNELNSSPEPFGPNIKQILNRLYGVLANNVAGQPLFKNQPSLAEFVNSAKQNGL